MFKNYEYKCSFSWSCTQKDTRKNERPELPNVIFFLPFSGVAPLLIPLGVLHIAWHCSFSTSLTLPLPHGNFIKKLTKTHYLLSSFSSSFSKYCKSAHSKWGMYLDWLQFCRVGATAVCHMTWVIRWVDLSCRLREKKKCNGYLGIKGILAGVVSVIVLRHKVCMNTTVVKQFQQGSLSKQWRFFLHVSLQIT